MTHMSMLFHVISFTNVENVLDYKIAKEITHVQTLLNFFDQGLDALLFMRMTLVLSKWHFKLANSLLILLQGSKKRK